VIIFVAGIDLLVESVSALARGANALHHSLEVLVVAFVSAVISYWIFAWEKRVGQRLNSQSLLANADESRADIMTSLAVFLGTGATYYGIPWIELAVAAGLSLLIIWLGIKHGRTAIYALLDASLDPELEREVVSIPEKVPGIMKIEQLRLRRAGPFCFGVAHVHMRKFLDVARAHQVAHEAVRAARDEIRQVEMLTIHVEPFHPDVQNVMVRADESDLDAAVSEHFGRAVFFLFATVSAKGVGQTEWIENTSREKPVRAGLEVIKDTLKTRSVDAVLTRQIGEIAFHPLRDCHVDVYAASKDTVRNTLGQFAGNKLPPVIKPTHESEAAGHQL